VDGLRSEACGGFRSPYGGGSGERPIGWIDLWSFARYRLGIKKTEFFALTLAMLDALMARDLAQREWQEILFAQLAVTTVSFGFRAPEKSAKVEDFMPSRWGRKVAKVRVDAHKRMTAKQRTNIADTLRGIMAAHMQNGEPEVR
jgi:hypothetical protein